MTTCLDAYLDMVKEEGEVSPSFNRDDALIMTMRYLFGEWTLATMQDKFMAKNGLEFDRRIRKLMVSDPTVMYQLKFPLYQAICHDGDRDAKVAYALEQGLAADDVELLDLALKVGPLRNYFKRLVSCGYRALSINDFQREIDKALRSNRSNTQGFVHAKMRFLRHWGLNTEGLVGDCESRAFEALLNQYPVFESRLHFNNLYKLSVRQAGLKIINYYTTKGRNVFDESGEYRKSAMEVETRDGNVVDGYDQGWDMPSSGLTGHQNSNDEEVLQVRSLLGSGKLDRQDREFLSLLVGETTPAFEHWLMDAHNIQNVDRVVTACTPRYRRLVMEFSQYPIAKLRRIQDMMAGNHVSSNGRTYLESFEPPALPTPLRRINSDFFIATAPISWMPELPYLYRSFAEIT